MLKSRVFAFRFNLEKNKEIIDWLEQQNNKTQSIIYLIKKEIAKEGLSDVIENTLNKE